MHDPAYSFAMNRPFVFLIMLFACFTAFPALSAPLLRLPVDCALEQDCWLMALPDADPATDAARDYTCGRQTREGFTGTSIGIASFADMEKGVGVLAPASGTVTRLRDGEADQFRSLKEQAELKKQGKECGNGIFIEHEEGWTTQLCNLRKDSVTVKKGDTVKVGQKIAEIGLSGVTDHPQVTMTVRHDGIEVDPFSGNELKSGRCGFPPKPLWASKIKTDGFNLYDAGFADKAPDFGLISEGKKPATPTRDSTGLVFWFAYFGAQKGDRIDITLSSPAGMVLSSEQMVQQQDNPRQYIFVGKTMPSGIATTPKKGAYKGEARLTRITQAGDTITRTISRELQIE
jgi:murein DD-endopeptidase MepM/ murein hydrolase activator NlpD